MYPVTTGYSAPPKLPIIFMVPESVPANFPPISMQVPHDVGITRSLQKLAQPRASTTASGRCRKLARINKLPAPPKPVHASSLRVLLTLPVRRLRNEKINPPNNEPR